MCRAVGEYAGQQGQGEEGSAAVTAFFKALEAYDYALLQVGAPPSDLLSLQVVGFMRTIFAGQSWQQVCDWGALSTWPVRVARA